MVVIASSPRRRGDGPSSRSRSMISARRSPRRRGDGPAIMCDDDGTSIVLPADAGMARVVSKVSWQYLRVLPADAGMARRRRWRAEGCSSFSPQTRGWPVSPELSQTPPWAFSPQTRGWPVAGRGLIISGREFSPQTRGWPGLTGERLQSHIGSPRRRGDGPRG